MSIRKLRSSKKPKQERVPTPLWFQQKDLFDAEFDSEDEKNGKIFLYNIFEKHCM